MKTTFLIDGFNFYHSIKPLEPKYHWLNYYAFCKHFLTANDSIKDVYLFTAEAYWIPDAVKRHRVFLEACKLNGIKIIMGKFKEKSGYCPKCKEKSIHHEEKYTDVNIALTAYRLAAKRETEQIIFITGDTDLVPSLKAIKEDFPKIRVGFIFPYHKANVEIKDLADFSYKTRLDTLANYVMPPELVKPSGQKIRCPEEWM